LHGVAERYQFRFRAKTLQEISALVLCRNKLPNRRSQFVSYLNRCPTNVRDFVDMEIVAAMING
jgi:hypothetical protein